MSRYVLSGWSAPGGADQPSQEQTSQEQTSREQTQAAQAAVDVVDRRLQDTGSWVFAGGPHGACRGSVEVRPFQGE